MKKIYVFVDDIICSYVFSSKFLKKTKNIDILHIWNLWNLSFLPIFEKNFCSNSGNLPISDMQNLTIGLHMQICFSVREAHWAAV